MQMTTLYASMLYAGLVGHRPAMVHYSGHTYLAVGGPFGASQ